MTAARSSDVVAHYGDCAVGDADWLHRPGRWSASQAIDVLRAWLSRPSVAPAGITHDVVEWTRRDLPELRTSREPTTPDALYRQIASTGEGEAMFASGHAGATQLGYAEELDAVDPWRVERFVGLGRPWLLGLPRAGDRVVDLGSGAGVDLAIAGAAVGSSGHAIGLDRLPYLAAAREGRRPGATVLASATACPIRSRSANLVVANGLPPLLGTRSSPAALAECHRLLDDGGELRFTTLVAGPDLVVEALSDVDVIDAVRCSKPLCAQYRRLLDDAGFAHVAIHDGPSPFVPGYRAGPVRAVLIAARRA